MLSTSITLKRAPKDGKDGEGITILSTSVRYAISESGVNAPTSGWTESVQQTTTAKPYLWTRTTVTYSKGDPVVSYSVSRQGTDGTNGTSFTPKGTALGHYENYTKLKASSIEYKEYGDAYLLDTAKDAIVGVKDAIQAVVGCCVARLVEETDARWYIDKAAVGDAYNIDGRLWVNNGKLWVDFGEVKGADGKDGQNLTMIVSPSNIILDAGEHGEPPANNPVSFYYYGFFGNEIITDVTDGAEFSISFPTGCNLRETYLQNGELKNTVVLNSRKNGGQGDFDPAGIVSTEYTVGGNKKYAVATSAYFVLSLTYKGFVVQQRIDITCNMALFSQSYVRNDYYMKSNYATNQYVDGKEKAITSSIEQQANEISLRVSKKEYDKNKDEVSSSLSEIKTSVDKIKLSVEETDKELGEAKASLDLCVKKDKDGNLESEAKLSADQIILEGHHMNFKGDQITIKSNNFTLDADGNMSANDATFSGTVRSPYRKAQSGEDLSKTDNVFLESSSWMNYFNLKWDKSQIGRTIRIANYTEDSAFLSSVSGKYFVTVNGMQVEQIGIAPLRCCVLHGLGYGDNFIAWCVEQSYTYKAVLPQYGMKYLSKGIVALTDTTPKVEYQKTVNSSDDKVTVSRISTGWYRLLLPKSWSAAYKSGGDVLVYRIGVILQGLGYSKDDDKKAAPIKATVKGIGWTTTSKTQIYIDVWTSDDETVNDGDFQFLIYNMDGTLDE